MADARFFISVTCAGWATVLVKRKQVIGRTRKGFFFFLERLMNRASVFAFLGAFGGADEEGGMIKTDYLVGTKDFETREIPAHGRKRP